MTTDIRERTDADAANIQNVGKEALLQFQSLQSHAVVSGYLRSEFATVPIVMIVWPNAMATSEDIADLEAAQEALSESGSISWSELKAKFKL